MNDGCALAGRHGRARRHRPYPSPSYFSAQSHTTKITIYMQSAQTKPTTHTQSTKRNRRGGACVPARTSAQRRFHTKKYTYCTRGMDDGCAPYRATRAGTQAPSLPISIIFFHAIPHKQNNYLHAIRPNDINRPCAIRPYPSPPNRTVCPYPIGVILSIAQGWQVQRSLPWVTMQARRLPPWGLYFFSSHIITTRGE